MGVKWHHSSIVIIIKQVYKYSTVFVHMYNNNNTMDEAKYSSERFMIPCFLDLWPVAEYNERYLARTYSASNYVCISKKNQHNLSQPWVPSRLLEGLDIPQKGVSCFIGPKAANNVSYGYSGVLEKFGLRRESTMTQLSSSSSSLLHLHICLRQRVYIPPPSKTQSEASHFFPLIIAKKKERKKTFN